MTPPFSHLTCALGLLAGCFSPDLGDAEPEIPGDASIFEPGEIVGGGDADRIGGAYVVTDVSADALPVDSIKLVGTRIFYMNRDGGTFHRETQNNSSDNATTIGGSTSVIDPWSGTDQGWDEIMACVSDQFARFDVTITDIDPGELPHIESVVAGRPEDLGLPKNVGGVSPFASNCSVIERSIVYTFAELFGDNHQFICQVVAQEVAHSIGLDHELLCEDPMTYLGGCGAKTFQDESAPCGESDSRPCACGAATQNSVQLLSARLGTPEGPGSPEVAIVSPVDGDLVDPGFMVDVEATDDDDIDEVRVSIDGVPYASIAAAPYSVAIDMELDIGRHTVDVEAIDMTGASARTSVDVILVPGGGLTNPSNPLDNILPGCAAAAGPADALGFGFLALLLCGVGRRRSRRRSLRRRRRC